MPAGPASHPAPLLRKELFLILSASLLAGIFLFVLSFRSPIVMDCGILIDRSWRIFMGQVPYRDFYCVTTPLTFFTQALAFKLFSPKVFWMKVFLAAQMAALVLLAGLFAWRFLKFNFRTLCFVLPLVILWLPGVHLMFPWYDVDGVFWGFAALFCLGAAFHRGKSWPIFAAGLAAGLSFLSKQNIGGASWVGGALFLLSQRADWKDRARHGALFVSGIALPVACAGLYFYAEGALPQAIEWVFLRSADRLGGDAARSVTLQSALKIVAGKSNHFIKLLIVFYLWALWESWRKRDDAETNGRLRLGSLAFAWAVVGLSALQDGGLRYPILQIYLGIVMGVLLSERLENGFRPAAAALALVCLLLAAWSPVVRFRQASPLQITWQVDHPRLAGFNFRKSDRDLVQGLLDFEKTIPKSDPVLVFPDPLFFYFATGRISPTPAVPFLPFSWDISAEQRAALPDSLRKAGVPWAIIGQEQYYDSGYLRFGSSLTWEAAARAGTAMATRGDFPDLRHYLHANFAEVPGPPGFWVLKKRRE